MLTDRRGQAGQTRDCTSPHPRQETTGKLSSVVGRRCHNKLYDRIPSETTGHSEERMLDSRRSFDFLDHGSKTDCHHDHTVKDQQISTYTDVPHHSDNRAADPGTTRGSLPDRRTEELETG